jgi:glycosyltransferase involved in cell wall biosynthesis
LPLPDFVKISIVITTCDRVSLLRRAIASALAQTLTCEIIVVDDASRDGTADYLRELGDRVRYWRNSQRLGHAESVNRGVSLAQGQWIKLLDDDDYLAPDCLASMYGEIVRYPGTVIASCQAIQVDEKGGEIRRTRRIGREDTLFVPQADIHYRMLLENLPFGTPAQVMFDREVFIRSGGWNADFDLDYDDIESWVKIACFGDAVFINRCLAYRTVWPGGYNQKFPILERFSTNKAIKEKIYTLVDDKYRKRLPSLGAIEGYLQLYWALIALKQGQISIFTRLLFSSLLSVPAWGLLIQVLSSRISAGKGNLDEE